MLASLPRWQHVHTRARNRGLATRARCCLLVWFSLWFVCSMLCGLIHCCPKHCRVKLSHIFQSGPPGFLKLQLVWTTVKHSHNTWSKNNQLFVADQVLSLITHVFHKVAYEHHFRKAYVKPHHSLTPSAGAEEGDRSAICCPCGNPSRFVHTANQRQNIPFFKCSRT